MSEKDTLDLLQVILICSQILDFIFGLITAILAPDPYKKRVIFTTSTILIVLLLISFGIYIYSIATTIVLHPTLQQYAPYCSNVEGAEWRMPQSKGTKLDCHSDGLLMQQTTNKYVAELDLHAVNSKIYSQTTFSAKVDIIFQNRADHATIAGLLIQTPVAPNVYGGYYLGIKSSGYWALTRADNGMPLANGIAGVDPTKPITIGIMVEHGTLIGNINGHEVVTYDDSNASTQSTVLGLIVWRNNAKQSSQVLFSNFELDTQ